MDLPKTLPTFASGWERERRTQLQYTSGEYLREGGGQYGGRSIFGQATLVAKAPIPVAEAEGDILVETMWTSF